MSASFKRGLRSSCVNIMSGLISQSYDLKPSGHDDRREDRHSTAIKRQIPMAVDEGSMAVCYQRLMDQ